MFLYLFLQFKFLPTSLAATEDTSPCKLDQGVPGELYTCPLAKFEYSDEQPCTWYKPNTRVPMGSIPLRSIGPDAGGISAFYSVEGCGNANNLFT
jgi:hypothetical protein